jgi:hypothetical protein
MPMCAKPLAEPAPNTKASLGRPICAKLGATVVVKEAPKSAEKCRREIMMNSMFLISAA